MGSLYCILIRFIDQQTTNLPSSRSFPADHSQPAGPQGGRRGHVQGWWESHHLHNHGNTELAPDLIFIIKYQKKHNYPSLLFAINLVNIISVEASVREGVHVQAQFLVLQSPEAPALHSPLSHHFSPHQVNLNFLSFSSRRKPWDLCIKIII